MGRDITTRMGATFEVGDTVMVSEDIGAMKAGQYQVTCSTAIGLKSVEVTEEMMREGLKASSRSAGGLAHKAVADIYRAMHAVSPVPLVSDAEIPLTRERDEAQALTIEATNMCASLDAKLTEAHAALASFHGLYEQHRIAAQEVKALREAVEVKAARIRVLEHTVRTYQETGAARMNAEGYAALMADPDAGKKPESPKPTPEAPRSMPATALNPPKGDQRRVGG